MLIFNIMQINKDILDNNKENLEINFNSETSKHIRKLLNRIFIIKKPKSKKSCK